MVHVKYLEMTSENSVQKTREIDNLSGATQRTSATYNISVQEEADASADILPPSALLRQANAPAWAYPPLPSRAPPRELHPLCTLVGLLDVMPAPRLHMAPPARQAARWTCSNPDH